MKRPVIIFSLLLLCLPGCNRKAPPGSHNPSSGSRDLMELRTADRLLTQKQCAEAADVYQRYLARLPKDHVAWNNLGLSYLCDKKYELAVQAFQQALLYAPTFTDVHNNIGAAYMEMKDYDRASAEFKKALLDPNYPVAGPYFNLARVALMQGNYEQSRALAKKVMAILPKEPSPRLLYSLSLEKLGRTEEATDSFLELLKLSPDNVEACYHLGMALSAKDPCQAQEYFRKVIDADPLGSLAQEAAVEARKLNCKH